ncbi:hypothetical protein TNCV_2731851 [Trichonephila clavipes]|nr:hypothetical protein TNCV_2731851 [Trichonephila clavipes]
MSSSQKGARLLISIQKMILSLPIETVLMMKHSQTESTFMPSASSWDPQNRSSRMSFSRRVSPERRGTGFQETLHTPLPQAATPFASGLQRNQMVSDQHSPQHISLPFSPLQNKSGFSDGSCQIVSTIKGEAWFH